MKNLNNKVKNSIKKIFQMGTLYIIVGIVCLFILFKVTVSDPLINIPFAVIGIILGYYLVTYIDPGGRIDYWFFSSSKQTNDQITIYKLIAQHKSNRLILLTTIIFILIYSILNLSHATIPNVIKINNILWLIFWSTLTMITLGNGVKYISAWWNINKK